MTPKNNRQEYWQHKTTGEVWVIEIRNSKPVSQCGPIHYSEMLPDRLTQWDCRDPFCLPLYGGQFRRMFSRNYPGYRVVCES